MKIHIHPDYRDYEPYIRQTAHGDYKSDLTYCNKRNTVERVVWQGKPFVVKRFKRPTLANCVIYTWLRKSKARRAFEYAEVLLERGIETARPVAYIECKRHGFFHTGYFISEYLPYPLMADLKHLDLPTEEKQRIGKEFLTFTARLHEQGILPKDYNLSNIFFHREADGYHFALIDINRLRIGKVPQEKDSIRFFEQSGVSVSKSIDSIGFYAALRGFNTDRCLFFILLYRLLTEWESRFKRHVLHPLRGH